ncbi:MAG: hypothetical protein C4K48_07370 [Candidatus Thorarchaeota archaeon]|nr:MAG: hypothetical protein C4K48_07370 [Candidatus Thorarchaeota archaeon]
MTTPEDIIDLVRNAVGLKRVNRSGWGIAGVDRFRPESVAEHSYGTIISSIYISQYLAGTGVQLNIEKTLIMAAIHDLPESLTSDIPHDASQSGKSSKETLKREMERKAIQTILRGKSGSSKQLMSIWKEYEDCTTIEARLVRGADIIDMLVHALDLEDSGVSPRILHRFFASSQHTFETLGIDILSAIYGILLEMHRKNADDLNIRFEI